MFFSYQPVSILGAYRLSIPHLIHTLLVVCLLIVPAPAATPDSTTVSPPVIPIDSIDIDILLIEDDPNLMDLDLSISFDDDPNLPPADWITPAGDSTFVLDS